MASDFNYRQPLLIPGEAFPSQLSTQARPSSGLPRLLRVFVALWFLAGLGYFAFFLHSHSGKPAQAATLDPRQPTAISTEDLIHHMDLANTKLSDASARILRAEDQVQRALPGVERTYLLVEQQHLKNAYALTEAGRRDVEQARQEFDLILNSLRKEHELK